MSRRALSFAALIAFTGMFAACGAVGPDSSADSEDVARSGREIIGGSKATAYPEAVLVNMKQNGQVTAACSGSLIAPKVVLTAGHCVYQFTGWDITAPYAAGQKASATSGATLDWKNTSDTVDPSMHDVGLVFLSTPITLSSYPTLAGAPVANGASIVNIGRINNGTLSSTNLYVSQPLTVKNASTSGFPYDYIGNEIIESGDSGGPDMAAGTHNIVAVNSGAGGGTEVLARVDLVLSWINQQVAAHGGFATSGGTSSSSSSSSGSSSSGGATACSHGTCTAGTKLTSTCDPCAAAVCSADSYCCTTQWDSQCVSEVPTFCGKSCSGSSSSSSSSSGSTGSSSSSSSGGTTADPCNGVTYAGKCVSNTVVWCENSSLHQLSCGSTKKCGYDSANAYYNCL